MLLDQNSIFIKDRAGFREREDAYELLDPANLKPIGRVVDESSDHTGALGILLPKGLRARVLNVYDPAISGPVLSIRRKGGFGRARIEVLGPAGYPLSSIKCETWTLGGALDILDAFGNPVGNLKGDWNTWTFTFTLMTKQILGVVTRQGAAPTRKSRHHSNPLTASLHPDTNYPKAMAHLLSAAIALDMAYKAQ